MGDEFSLEDLHALVDQALEGRSNTPPPAPRPKRQIPLAFNEGRLLEHLADILPKHKIPIASQQEIFADLRNELHSGLEKTDLRMMHTVVKHCRRCPDVTPEPQLPEGNLVDPDVIFVLENQQMSERSREYLTTALKSAGFSGARVAFSALTRCPLPGYRSPDQLEVSNCSGYVFSEIQNLQPRLIVALGSTASSVLLSSPVKITEQRGQIFWIGPWAVLVTYAPAYVLRGKGSNDFDADLRKAYQFVYGDS